MMTMTTMTMRLRQACIALFVLAPLCGCYESRQESAPSQAAPPQETAPRTKIRRATAFIDAKSGSSVSGTATFSYDESKGSVALDLQLQGAPPGTHALHIHEVGDCSAEDGSSAGSHWNPTHEDHGKWGQAPFHLGDIGNIEVDAEGKGSVSMSTDMWEIGTGSPKDILGKSVILHEKPDDFMTQPTGAAGGRIGCGVIEAS